MTSILDAVSTGPIDPVWHTVWGTMVAGLSAGTPYFPMHAFRASVLHPRRYFDT